MQQSEIDVDLYYTEFFFLFASYFHTPQHLPLQSPSDPCKSSEESLVCLGMSRVRPSELGFGTGSDPSGERHQSVHQQVPQSAGLNPGEEFQ